MDVKNKNHKHFEARFGDVTTISGVTNVISYDMNMFDDLEYDCWALVKKYADLFGLKIENNGIDDIDFSVAKEVQETILQLFENAGIELADEHGEKDKGDTVTFDESVNLKEDTMSYYYGICTSKEDLIQFFEKISTEEGKNIF